LTRLAVRSFRRAMQPIAQTELAGNRSHHTGVQIERAGIGAFLKYERIRWISFPNCHRDRVFRQPLS
jgi:hypothetical protein